MSFERDTLVAYAAMPSGMRLNNEVKSQLIRSAMQTLSELGKRISIESLAFRKVRHKEILDYSGPVAELSVEMRIFND